MNTRSVKAMSVVSGWVYSISSKLYLNSTDGSNICSSVSRIFRGIGESFIEYLLDQVENRRYVQYIDSYSALPAEGRMRILLKVSWPLTGLCIRRTAPLRRAHMYAPSATAPDRSEVQLAAVAPFSSAASRDARLETRLRITRRGRAVLAGLIAVPVVAVALLFAVNGGGAMATGAAGSQEAGFDYVTVHAGQSLWELAESMAPSADPRDVIAEIMTLNQLETASVLPGQLLAIPAVYSR